MARLYVGEAEDCETIIFREDIIRENLKFILRGICIRGAYSIKISRDAELDLEDEYDGDLAEKIEKKLAKRDAGLATRFLYQPGIPLSILESLISSLGLSKASIVAGGRYHNLRDLAVFPVKDDRLSYPKWPSQKRSYTDPQSLFQLISEKDILLHAPYE